MTLPYRAVMSVRTKYVATPRKRYVVALVKDDGNKTPGLFLSTCWQTRFAKN